MKTSTLLTALLRAFMLVFVISVASCQKEDDLEPPVTPPVTEECPSYPLVPVDITTTDNEGNLPENIKWLLEYVTTAAPNFAGNWVVATLTSDTTGIYLVIYDQVEEKAYSLDPEMTKGALDPDGNLPNSTMLHYVDHDVLSNRLVLKKRDKNGDAVRRYYQLDAEKEKFVLECE